MATSPLEPAVVIPTDGWPSAVAVRDINDDGRLDVVLTNDCDGCDTLIFKQAPTGGLLAPERYPTGRGTSVAIGDFNGDGRQDIAVAAGSLSLRYQQSDGMMGPEQTVSLPAGAFKLAAADFDRDGRMDLVVIPWGSNSDDVYLLLQNASGGFHQETHTLVHYGFDDLEVGDLNDDGLTDVVIVSLQGQVRDNIGVLFGRDDSERFEPPMYLDMGYESTFGGAALGDFTGDGNTDLAVSVGQRFGVFNGVVSILSGDPTSGYSVVETAVIPFLPSGLTAMDLDRDGRLDLAIANTVSLHWWTQECTGGLSREVDLPIPFANYRNPHQVAGGDVTGDGIPDLVIASDNHGLLVIAGSADYIFRNDFESGSICWSSQTPAPASIATDAVDPAG